MMNEKQIEAALRLAREAMEYADACLKKQLTTKTKHEYAQDLLLEAGNAICEALAEQPAQQQEPFGYFRYDLRLDAWVQNREGRPGTAFYTSPPANANAGKPWVGLEESEWREIDDRHDWTTMQGRIDVAEEIEAKLREKNA